MLVTPLTLVARTIGTTSATGTIDAGSSSLCRSTSAIATGIVPLLLELRMLMGCVAVAVDDDATGTAVACATTIPDSRSDTVLGLNICLRRSDDSGGAEDRASASDKRATRDDGAKIMGRGGPGRVARIPFCLLLSDWRRRSSKLRLCFLLQQKEIEITSTKKTPRPMMMAFSVLSSAHL